MQSSSNDDFMSGAPDSAGIISSLISTFSALGAAPSPELHYDHLFDPAASLSSPGPSSRSCCSHSSSSSSSAAAVDRSRLRHSIVPSTGFGMDYGAYRAPQTGNNYDISHPDEAAIAPVVRMVKNSSPLPASTREPRPSALHSSRLEVLSDLRCSASSRADESAPLHLLDLRTLSQKGSRASLASTISGKSFRSFRLPNSSCSKNVTGPTARSSGHQSPALRSVRSIPSMSESLSHQDGYAHSSLSPPIAGSYAFHTSSSRTSDGEPDSTRNSFAGRSKSNHNSIARQLKSINRKPSTSSQHSDMTFHPYRPPYLHNLDGATESDPEDHSYHDTLRLPGRSVSQKQRRTYSHDFMDDFGEIDEDLGLEPPGHPCPCQASNDSSCRGRSHHHMAGGKFHDHDDRAANILEAPHSNNDYAKDRAPSAYSHERDGQVFDRLDMLANTLDTGITSRSKQCHWLEIKDQTPTEDPESAPAPAVSTRATRPSSSHWSSNSSKKRHTLRTSISPTFNGVKSPTDRRKPPATAADVKHHARRHIRRSHNDSTTLTNPANIDSPSHLKSHRSHSFSGTVSVATSQTHNKSTPSGPNDRPQQPQSQPQTSMRPSSSDSIDTAVDDFLLAPRLNQTVQHPAEDRIIAFSDVGDPKGHVAFVCLGMGLTRYVMAFYDDLARALKLRLITPDRPGVGGSEPCDESRTVPLTWPDDIAIICNHLKITRFSLLAHSAGAIYALATALRMPQHIRGRIHLLAPWIPPSQIEMSNISIIKGNPSKSTSTDAKGPKARSLAMPYSQRLLKALPTPIFKVANAGFMSVTSASVSPNSSKFASRKKRWKNSSRYSTSGGTRESATPTDRANETTVCQPLQSPVSPPQIPQNMNELPATSASTQDQPQANLESLSEDVQIALKQRSLEFDARLTNSIWELATTNANPSIDLLVCLERRQPIGFRYADVSRSVVIHHGARDTRVPLENVRWLGKTMQHCEVRVLEQEGHSLMANAVVMGNVLTEIAGECNDRTNRHSSEHTDHKPGPSTRQTVSANG